MVGIVLTLIVFLMAVGIVPAIRWPRVGGRPAGSPVADRAETCMRRAMEAIAAAKAEAGVVSLGVPPGAAGALIGSEWTPLVTTLGSLEAKQLASAPVWAAVLSERIRERGLDASDLVAASFSGSFPGLNLATVCACQAMDITVLAVSSVTASAWGATDPGFTWPEMEVILARAGIITAVTLAVSVGGDGDRGLDLEEEGRALAQSIAEQTSAALGARHLRPTSLEDAIRARLHLLDRAAGTRRLGLFVNVGGTSASLGRSPAILRLKSGWVPPRPFDLGSGRGLVARMVERGVPVLHLLNVRDLAARWGVL
ncbi:MAG: poly-gamma-glutamate system protein [Acidobacteriota bacterium]